MGHQHFAGNRRAMGDQSQSYAGKQGRLPDLFGIEQQVQRGDDGEQIECQGQNRDHDHNQVVVEQAVGTGVAVYLAQDMLASCATADLPIYRQQATALRGE